jgi:SAM-dependent methyltransferase
VVRQRNRPGDVVAYAPDVASGACRARPCRHAVRSLYRRMATEHAHLNASAQDWAAVQTSEVARTPVDQDLIDAASDLAPGKALELGCGMGQNSVWLAERGWTVTGVDGSAGAIADARSAAHAAGLRTVFDVVDITEWRPASRFDLVFSAFALPARGMGRSRMLETAATAVAPGGTILISEFDISLRKEGWMAEKYLVSGEEIERHLIGFRVNRSVVRMRRHKHGYDERVLPVVTIAATRRTDLRRL